MHEGEVEPLARDGLQVRSMPERSDSKRRLRRAIGYLFTVFLLAGAAAQLVRDQSLAIALLMYVPLAFLSFAAIAWDLALAGHALPRRGLLAILASAIGLFAVGQSYRPALPPDARTTREPIVLVHWNTQWGAHGKTSVRAMFESLAAHDPDIVCLSEAPRYAEVKETWNALRPGYHYATSENGPNHRYQYRMTVISRAPVTLRTEWQLRIGRAALFEIHGPSTLRIVLADFQSSPLLPRSPSLLQLAEIVEEGLRAHRPVDVVAGDFNTPGNFLGFERLSRAGEGYERTALWSGEWRATWPTTLGLPVFDIDHIWVRRPMHVHRSTFFTHPSTDHRGQRVVVALP
jgi:endonuclease/exonuclease/phosphatase family metal-dependent hydrolase